MREREKETSKLGILQQLRSPAACPITNDTIDIRILEFLIFICTFHVKITRGFLLSRNQKENDRFLTL